MLTPPAPPELAHLMGIFGDLAVSRAGGFGPQPLALTEIDAWCRLSGTPLAWWEVQVVRQLDRLWLSAWSAGQAKKGV